MLRSTPPAKEQHTLSGIKRVSPEAAQRLLEEGYVYVDVRSEPEFEEGHVPAALNVPLLHRGPAGLEPNPDFLDVMQSAFGKTEGIVVGCRSGSRSLQAARTLVGAGYEHIVDLRTGWEGSRDAFGRREPGWLAKGFPAETGAPDGKKYEDVKNRTPPA